MVENQTSENDEDCRWYCEICYQQRLVFLTIPQCGHRLCATCHENIYELGTNCRCPFCRGEMPSNPLKCAPIQISPKVTAAEVDVLSRKVKIFKCNRRMRWHLLQVFVAAIFILIPLLMVRNSGNNLHHAAQSNFEYLAFMGKIIELSREYEETSKVSERRSRSRQI